MKDLNIVWYVLCWNEMPILPFMIDYWKQIASKVIVYDNNSSDGSIEYLQKFDWIEVRPYPYATGDKLNDQINMQIKNECWKECKNSNVDWVIVSDLDEILYSKDLFTKLKHASENDIAIIKPLGYDFVSQTFPVYTENQLLHEQIKTCTHIPMWDKPIIFNPNKVEEIDYCPGGHSLDHPKYTGKYTDLDDFYLFHFKYLSIDYLIQKRFASKVRMSEINIRKRWGFEYLFNETQIANQFNERWKKAKDFSVDTLLDK